MPVPRASMGYVGSVTFGNVVVSAASTSFNGNVTVRAKRADIRASQAIDFPDVVDGRIDRSIYQLGPRIVEGNVSFPLVHEGSGVTSIKNCGTSINHGQLFWALATQRDQFGRLINDSMEMRIRYADDTAFIYPAALVNQLTMSVVQEGTVDMSVDIMAGANSSDNVRLPWTGGGDLNFLSPARIVTWNDFIIRIFGDDSVDVSGEWIRSFECTVNNNAERFYTLNNRLAPQDISAKKRHIEGNIVLMGRNTNLSELAYSNQQRFTSNSKIAFGYKLGSSGNPVFSTVLNGVIFEIEEIAITNELVQTTIPFHALGDCECGYEATEIGSSTAITTSVPSCGAFGGRTSPDFPNFRPE